MTCNAKIFFLKKSLLLSPLAQVSKSITPDIPILKPTKRKGGRYETIILLAIVALATKEKTKRGYKIIIESKKIKNVSSFNNKKKIYEMQYFINKKKVFCCKPCKKKCQKAVSL